jgi:hypothetical protein
LYLTVYPLTTGLNDSVGLGNNLAALAALDYNIKKNKILIKKLMKELKN